MKTSKNSIIRRLQRYQGKLKKILVSKDLTNKSAILVNSFPKSGTHLLKQVFEPLGFDDYLQHPSSLPSFPHRINNVKSDIAKIKRVVQNELMCAHFFARDELIEYISRINIVHFFIYRDPRDVVLSEVHYLTEMNKHHALHKFFKNIKTEEERIKFAMMGNDYLDTRLPFPNIKERVLWYKEWIKNKNCFCIKFEDLVNPITQDEIIKQIILHLIDSKALKMTLKEGRALAFNGINPNKSHTYRVGGGKNKWKSKFTDEHKQLFKSVAGDLLIDLGYETDLNW
jgi:hypothetical protein